MPILPGAARSQTPDTGSEPAQPRDRTQARLDELFVRRDRGLPRGAADAGQPADVRWESQLIGKAEAAEAAEAARQRAEAAGAEAAASPEHEGRPGFVVVSEDSDAAGEPLAGPAIAGEDAVRLVAVGPGRGPGPAAGIPRPGEPGAPGAAAGPGDEVAKIAPRHAAPKRAATRPAARKAPAKRAATKASARKAAPRKPSAKAAASAAGAVASSGRAVAFCPHCALLYDPPPASSRQCRRCRQRIVVRRIDGHVAYLTESAVALHEAEARKAADAGRYGRETGRWLAHASSAGAAPGKVARLRAAASTAETAAAARDLYLATVDDRFGAARRDQRWEDASRIKRDAALVLHRMAGSPVPPSAEVVGIHREGVAVELKGLAKIAREVEVAGPPCCEACRADVGRIFPIAKELATPRLPHAGCPKGLCRCSWDLSTRDRELVQRYLRRRPRPAARPALEAAKPEADASPPD